MTIKQNKTTTTTTTKTTATTTTKASQLKEKPKITEGGGLAPNLDLFLEGLQGHVHAEVRDVPDGRGWEAGHVLQRLLVHGALLVSAVAPEERPPAVAHVSPRGRHLLAAAAGGVSHGAPATTAITTERVILTPSLP